MDWLALLKDSPQQKRPTYIVVGCELPMPTAQLCRIFYVILHNSAVGNRIALHRIPAPPPWRLHSARRWRTCSRARRRRGARRSSPTTPSSSSTRSSSRQARRRGERAVADAVRRADLVRPLQGRGSVPLEHGRARQVVRVVVRALGGGSHRTALPRCRHRKAWKALGNASKDEAMTQYLRLLKATDPSFAQKLPADIQAKL